MKPFNEFETKLSSMMAQLKSATREEHEAIEKQIDLSSCSLDLGHYRSVVARFFGFFEPVEAALRRVDGLENVIRDLPFRMRAGLLEYDLVTLGFRANDFRDLQRCRQLPQVNSVAQALGCLYVLEGSTLGGQIIARQLRERGFGNPQACRFFNSYGVNVGHMWKRLAEAVESYAADHPDEADTICASAKETFRALESWFAKS